MRKQQKIHFIHHLEKMNVPANLGDWICSPYYYFVDYFSQFTCVLHSDWAVLWHEIEKDDVVIFGGGGLLDNSDELNKVLNRILDRCENVILWGPGTHKYIEDNIFGKRTASLSVNFDRAALVGIRDYMHPSNLNFVPCASCLNPAFSVDNDPTLIKREIGTIKSALEQTFAVSGVPSSVTNAQPIGEVVKYILSSRVILVSSYHGAFWSMLLGRKVILPSSRLSVEKYKYFRYPVAFFSGNQYDEIELLKLADSIPDHPDFLEEARTINMNFFEQVKSYIDARIDSSYKPETVQIIAKRTAQLEFTMIELSNTLRRMNARLIDVEKR